MGLYLAYICPCICPKRFFNGLMFGRGRGKGGGGKGEGVAHYRKDFMFEVWEAYFQEGLLSKLCGVIYPRSLLILRRPVKRLRIK